MNCRTADHKRSGERGMRGHYRDGGEDQLLVCEGGGGKKRGGRGGRGERGGERREGKEKKNVEGGRRRMCVIQEKGRKSLV